MYDINPIKMVEGSVKSDTTTTKHSVPHKADYVNTNDMQNSAKNSENGVNVSENGVNVSENGRKNSVRDYSYDTLISKPNMVVTTLDADIPSDRKSVLNLAKTNAAKVGRVDENSNTVYVKVDDIDTEVIIGTNGLRHSIDRRFEINAPVAIKVGEVLKNSIKINELTPKNTEASETYVLAGVAKNVNKEPQIVTFVVNKFTNEVVEMDALYSLNSKTEKSGQKNKSRPGANPQAFLQNADYLIDSIISISDLLEYVNRYFPDILPEDVLKHFGHKSRPEGTIGESALYSVRDNVPTAYELLNENKRLEERNALLQEDIERLKELVHLQGKITHGKVFAKSSVNIVAKQLAKLGNSKIDSAVLAESLNELYSYIAEGDNVNFDTVMDKANVIARDINVPLPVLVTFGIVNNPTDKSKFELNSYIFRT